MLDWRKLLDNRETWLALAAFIAAMLAWLVPSVPADVKTTLTMLLLALGAGFSGASVQTARNRYKDMHATQFYNPAGKP